jgi:putative holliday junction resolvase
MSKILAIDFGLKRTGIALSDESKIFAFGHETIDSKELMNYLIQIVPREKIDTIVLGEPKRLNNTDTHISENVRLLKNVLIEKFSALKIVAMDERFTSKMASQSISMMGKNKNAYQNKGLVDKVSATIILQSYLENLS